MENYIVRVYRRDKADPNKLAGVFESVEDETRNTFTSLDSLIALLTPSPVKRKQAKELTDNSLSPVPTPASFSD